MAQQKHQLWLWLLMTSGILIELLGSMSDPALAQITPDETLGEERSVVTRDVQVRGSRGDRIDGGARRGANLFHSFREFNVNDGQRVYFANPAGIENILGRVTGTNVSDILGTLGVDGDANLFLLNPNGIIFGPNASLDVSGSFIATTGNRFNFPDGGEFSAINPQAPSLLTVSAPIGVQFGGMPGIITAQGSYTITNPFASLGVEPGGTLALLGGDIRLNGIELLSPDSRVDLGAASQGTVDLNMNNGLLELSFPKATQRADVFISGGGIDVAGSGRGSIIINAQNIEITPGVIQNSPSLSPVKVNLNAGILSEQASSSSQSGDIVLNARGNINIESTIIRNSIESDVLKTGNEIAPSTDNAGNIKITAQSLLMNDSTLDTRIHGIGNAGDIIIGAIDNISLFGNSIDSSGDFETTTQSSVLPLGAEGNAGNITIIAPSFTMSRTLLSSETMGHGNAGNIVIQATNNILLEGSISSSVSYTGSGLPLGAEGNAGNITIIAPSLTMSRALLSSRTVGRGNAGDIVLRGNDIFINNSELESAVGSSVGLASGAQGQGGNISITAGSLSLTSSSLNTAVFETGDTGSNSGSVNIQVDGPINFNQSSVFSQVDAGEGNGGDINITAGSLELLNGSQLFTITRSAGNAGNVTVDVDDVVVFHGFGSASDVSFSMLDSFAPGPSLIKSPQGNLFRSGIFSSAVNTIGFNPIEGRGGNVNITAHSFSLTNGARVIASTDGLGNAGNVKISARDSVVIDGSVDTDFAVRDTSKMDEVSMARYIIEAYLGDGEVERIDPSSLNFNQRMSSGLFTQTGGAGNAGSITINTPNLALQNGAQISAATAIGSNGQGGSVAVNASDYIVLIGNSELSVETSGAGRAGNIALTTNTLNVEQAARITATANSNATTTEQGGSIILNANQMNLAGTVGVFSETQSITPAGTLTLRSNGNYPTLNLNLQGGAQISASSSGSGLGGSLILAAPEAIVISGNGRLAVEARGSGNAGDMRINTDQLTIQNGARLSATATGAATTTARGGSILINAEDVSLDGASIIAETVSGRGGNIILQVSDSLRLDNSEISASAKTGQAGSLAINASESIDLRNNGRLAVEATAGGNASRLSLQTDRLTLQGGSEVTVSSKEAGTAGDLTVRASEIRLDQSQLTANTEAGSGGNIDLDDVDSLILNHGSTIAASTQDGEGGRVRLNTGQSPADRVEVSNGSQITTAATRNGQAGNIHLNTEELVVQGSLSENRRSAQSTNQNHPRPRNSAITATSRSAQGGNIRIDAEQITVRDNGRIAASTQTGQAGDLTVNAEDFVRLSDRGRLAVAARQEQGRAGNLTVNTPELLLENHSTIAASNISDRPENNRARGNITLQGLETLAVEDSRISASTETGRAGNLTVDADDSIELNNGRLLVQSTRGGQAGGVSLVTDHLTANNSEVSVNSTQGRAGNLSVDANSVILNDGSLTAQAGSGSGAEVRLENLDLLYLQNGSLISAKATDQANGGNVTIGATDGFIVVPPGGDSDIIADASEGNGGEIQITTQGIFGITEGRAIEGNGTNDIDASSEAGVQGSVTINRPTTDPSRGLTELPTDIINAANQIDRVCPTAQAGSKDPSEFIITGRGGLPANPETMLNGDSLLADWVTLNHQESTAMPNPIDEPSPEAPLVEAQGWKIGPQGEIIFLAQAPATVQTGNLPPTHCR